ncbi:hypothetical protein B0T24DRAFT_536882, partial [Lasiosphaeria ovina]
VLLSPAPSDEPSPVVSTPLDSPNPNPASLPGPGAQTMVLPKPSAYLSLPVTDARFVYNLTVETHPLDSLTSRIASNGGPLSAPIPTSYPQPPSSVSQVQAQAQARRSQVLGAEGLIQSPTPSAAVAPPPLKKRRTDRHQMLRFSLPSFIAKLDQHFQSYGGEQAFTSDIERPRMQLLKDACAKDDGFFLALHQLYCIWSGSSQEAHRFFNYPPQTIDSAFAIIETVLKKNQYISPAHRAFFVHFPVPIKELVGPTTNYASLIEQVGTFLNNLHTRFNWLRQASVTRRYPFLVDELLFHLACYSPVLQTIFFTASRRILGVTDGPYGLQMERGLKEDQKKHRNETTGLQFLPPIKHQTEIETRNAKFISYYKEELQGHAAHASSRGSHNSQPPSPFTPMYGTSAMQGQSLMSLGSPPMMAPSPYGQPPNGQMVTHFVPQGHTQMPQHYSPTIVPSQVMEQRSVGAQQRTHQQRLDIQLQAHLISHQQQQQAHLMSLQQQQQQQQQQQLQYQQQLQQVHQQQQQYQWFSNLRPGNTPGQPGHLVAPQIQRPLVQPHTQVSQAGLSLPPQTLSFAGERSTGHSASSAPPIPAPHQTTPGITQHPLSGAYQRHVSKQVKDPLLPAKGTLIPRPEWPFDPSDRKAITMALHQAHVRSPRRVVKENETERFYQAVKSLPAGPTLITPKNRVQELRFDVTKEQFALRSASSTNSGEILPVAQHFNGSLRWRVRCCKVSLPEKAISEQRWTTVDMCWPTNVFMKLNSRPLDIRRYSHNGKDLATELTDLVICGTNVIEIAVPDLGRDSLDNRLFAVEMLETLSHSDILKLVWERGVLPEQQTLQTIKRRLTPTDDDGIAFQAPDLSIDLADPFSALIFKIPARGVTCTHMECFDLETWLNTRPSKPPTKCPHSQVTCDCPTALEPSHPDKWRCPICFEDARPYSLRIDSFLLKVRHQLEKENRLRTKSMHVTADGSWSVVMEADDVESDDGDDVESDDGDDDINQATPRQLKRPSVPAAAAKRQDVEVIQID